MTDRLFDLEPETFTEDAEGPEGAVGWAEFSPCGRYRYRLGRRWGFGPPMAWIMLNPSTADAGVLDPTIRRCIGFAKREGYRAIEVLNLYGLRATNPRELLRADDPEGPDNAAAWRAVLGNPWNREAVVVAAFGSFAWDHPRLQISMAAANTPALTWKCLGITKRGAPRHPLYVRGDAPLVPWLDAWAAMEKMNPR